MMDAKTFMVSIRQWAMGELWAILHVLRCSCDCGVPREGRGVSPIWDGSVRSHVQVASIQSSLI